MKHWISCVARAYEREPGLFLLAAGVVLAVVFWHVPVPVFLFAEGGSGGSGLPPSCCDATENCESWGWKPNSPICSLAVFVGGCTKTDNTSECGEQTKSRPEVGFKYECWVSPPNQPPQRVCCTNTNTHGGNNPAYSEAEWERTVSVTASGSGDREIKFLPTVRLGYSGFGDADVCQNSAGQIIIHSGFFASMDVCGQAGIIDSEKSQTGWYYAVYTFEKVGTVWKFDKEYPLDVSFTLKKSCPCSEEADDPVQHVTVRVTVSTNSGVRLGKQGNDAIVIYKILEDTTVCDNR